MPGVPLQKLPYQATVKMPCASSSAKMSSHSFDTSFTEDDFWRERAVAKMHNLPT
jgi:hypothetical protein